MQVELRPHIGGHMVTGQPVDLRQDRIFVDGQHVGYVGRSPDAPINLIVSAPPEELTAAVREAVAAKYGPGTRALSAPPAIGDVVEQDPDDDTVD